MSDICIGTFPPAIVGLIKTFAKANKGCNVKFQLRGRGCRQQGKYQSSLPLSQSENIAVYIIPRKKNERKTL